LAGGLAGEDRRRVAEELREIAPPKLREDVQSAISLMKMDG
jgi:hypothetical protein